MQRRLRTIIASLSLLMCVAICMLWVRSYRLTDIVACDPQDTPAGGSEWFARSETGAVYFAHNMHLVNGFTSPGCRWGANPVDPRIAGFRVNTNNGGFNLGSFGLGLYRSPNRLHSNTVIKLPHWSMALLFSLMPTSWLFVRRSRSPAGCCQSCGYNLRASPNRCPECGKPRISPEK